MNERRQAWRTVGVAQRRCATFRARLDTALDRASVHAATDPRYEPVRLALADLVTELDMLMFELARLPFPLEYLDEFRPPIPASGAGRGIFYRLNQFNRSAGQFRYRLRRIQLRAQEVMERDTQLQPVVRQIAAVVTRVEAAIAAIASAR